MILKRDREEERGGGGGRIRGGEERRDNDRKRGGNQNIKERLQVGKWREMRDERRDGD